MKPDLSKYKNLPHFPDGRIDYTNSPSSVGVNCFVTFEGKLLLVKRSEKVGVAQGMWHVIAGYADEDKSIKQKALEELEEETTITEEHIQEIIEHEPITITEKKEWIIYPVHVTLKELPQITLDWENTEYVWVTLQELEDYDTLPNFRRTLAKLNLKLQ